MFTASVAKIRWKPWGANRSGVPSTSRRPTYGAPGNLEVVGGEIHVRLDPLSAPRRTAAIARLCEDLTATKTICLGTELTLVYSVKSGP